MDALGATPWKLRVNSKVGDELSAEVLMVSVPPSPKLPRAPAAKAATQVPCALSLRSLTIVIVRVTSSGWTIFALIKSGCFKSKPSSAMAMVAPCPK